MSEATSNINPAELNIMSNVKADKMAIAEEKSVSLEVGKYCYTE